LPRGFQLGFSELDGEVRSVAGYRYFDNLFAGRLLYVDDLVTRKQDRSRGFGDQLFDWLGELARKENCNTLELDSGAHEFDAHRFYLRKRMDIESHHFRLALRVSTRGRARAPAALALAVWR